MSDYLKDRPHGVTKFRAPKRSDFTRALRAEAVDLVRYPAFALVFGGAFVIIGLAIATLTYASEHSYWLVLAVMGFPMVGSLAALGFYLISWQHHRGRPITMWAILRAIWALKNGQVPWLAVIVVMLLLFWFFLGHMLFALFLGLQPMVNFSSSAEVFLSANGLTMLAIGTGVGAVFATLIFSMTLFGLPMLIDRDVDFMTAGLASIAQVMAYPVPYMIWGAVIGLALIAAIIPAFLRMFIVLPLFGHATWHLYKIQQISDHSRPQKSG
jgi:uncharacterized membrane protein